MPRARPGRALQHDSNNGESAKPSATRLHPNLEQWFNFGAYVQVSDASRLDRPCIDQQLQDKLGTGGRHVSDDERHCQPGSRSAMGAGVR